METLEVAIGLVFVFLLVSIVCSAIREGIEAYLKTRAAYLERGIRQLLHDTQGTGLAREFYEHPLISSLYHQDYEAKPHGHRLGVLERGRNLPTYIPASNFAVALMDLAARGPDPGIASHPDGPRLTVDGIRENVLNIENAQVRRALLTAVDAAQDDLARVQQNLEAWYDSGMDRVSGWYKRSTHMILLATGFVVAFALNVNTITIADYLYRDDAARTAVVERAATIAADSSIIEDYTRAMAQLDTLGSTLSLPIGWSGGWGAPRRGDEPGSDGYWNNLFAPLLGWLITAFAATFGAPFWFDLLNRLMVIRSTVKPREKSQDEGSEDRQPKGGGTPRPELGAPAPAAGPPPHAEAPEGGGARADAPRAAAAAALDGCDVAITDITTDEELPAATGGVEGR